MKKIILIAILLSLTTLTIALEEDGSNVLTYIEFAASNCLSAESEGTCGVAYQAYLDNL